MLVSELLARYKADGGSIKAACDVDGVLKDVNIKERLSYKEKRSLLDQVKYNGITALDGAAVYDSLIGDILFDAAVIKFYTDLEFSDNSPDEMDELCLTGLYDCIVGRFYFDYTQLRQYYDDDVKALLASENDTRLLLNRQISALFQKAAETLNLITEKVDKLDNKQLNKLARELGKLAASCPPDPR